MVSVTKKFILDTDPGIDDIEALLFLLSKTDIEIVAITTVCGNGSADLTFNNTLKVLDFIGERNIPVYKGADLAIDATPLQFDYFFGTDAMGNAELPQANIHGETEISSAEAIVHYCRKYKGEINLIAVGPLTNLAIAYLYDPKLPSYLKSLSIMGGDRNEKTKENCCDYAEFNARCDPVSLKYVFNVFSSQVTCPFYVIDWELCKRCALPTEIIDMVDTNMDPKVNQKKKELMRIIEDKTHQGVFARYSARGFTTADILAAMVSYDQSIIKRKTKAKLAECLTEGPTKGHVSFCEDEGSNAWLVDEMDMEAVIKYFVSIVTN